ncbi:cation transporter [Leptospira gomenensis]|uniref:Cation transporter n=1 Tax=Leptospira gomenensis TaxID=2484974 RepID=A0A5F1YAM7_9LEPT|nr:SMR family transporter [Leptospira gomenensis]TGK34449.1 cation transporter [Leptospira gomenensis]TGK41835.1 cation transporter [Leptospira gomenensis]TGK44772.1 cation transporter [Leptospira gomenensis]TGK65159.1 cation transporter [Leptospira gomenensis]
MQIQVLIVFIVALVFNALANILIKASSLGDAASNPEGVPGILRTILNPIFIGGLASFGLALLGYRFVLGKGLKLSLAYPVFTSAGFIIVLIVSSFAFKERLSWSQWAGIVLILAGVWLCAANMFDAKS